MLIGVVGAVISGWRAPSQLRAWLWLPLIAFLMIWAATPTIFWPMNHDLYFGAIGKISKSDAELARRWVAFDWVRVGIIAIGFISSVRAISMPGRSGGRPAVV